MSLPPKVLKIKRKRTDEPVDKLYVEHAKRRTTDDAFVYRRQVSEASIDLQRSSPEPKLQPGIPRVRATKPGDELKNLERLYRDVSRDGPAQSTQHLQPIPANISQARRTFRLTKPAVSSTSGQKRGRDAEDDVAIVVEQKRRKQFNGLAVNVEPQIDGSKSLKRPSARAPRALGQAKDPVQRKTSDAIQTAMQEMAAEHIGLHESDASDAASRNVETSDQDTAMSDSREDGDDVYDTYVRDGMDGVTVGSTTMETMSDSSGNVGYLAIDDEDEQLWETYAEGEDEDELDWDSEQDDENAENWYGADYPDEEVDSDDELGVNPYKYHGGGGDSDEDEYLDLDDQWGYGHTAKRHPWKRAEHDEGSDEASDSEKV